MISDMEATIMQHCVTMVRQFALVVTAGAVPVVCASAPVEWGRLAERTRQCICLTAHKGCTPRTRWATKQLELVIKSLYIFCSHR